MPDYSGTNFITMLGDYGWGLYINNGYVSYSSEYSISKHPTSNNTITMSEWNHVKVVVGKILWNFSSMDNLLERLVPMMRIYHLETLDQTIVTNQVMIAMNYTLVRWVRDDCNYYRGLLDNVSISDGEDSSMLFLRRGHSPWTTRPIRRRYNRRIMGYARRHHSCATVQLFSDEQVSDISGQAGDQYCFSLKLSHLQDTSNLMHILNTWIGTTGVSTSSMLILPTDIYPILGSTMILQKILLTICG